MAEAGGFVDTVADPSGVFLFRFESRQLVTAIHPDLPRMSEDRVPVVYRVNLRSSDGYFLAQQFAMRDKDVILVANSDGTQLLKFFALLRGVTGAVSELKSTTGASSATSHF